MHGRADTNLDAIPKQIAIKDALTSLIIITILLYVFVK
jgi:hypothetical protein